MRSWIRLRVMNASNSACWQPANLALTGLRPLAVPQPTQALLKTPESNAFTALPCGVCPVISECEEGGKISPQTCIYYSHWLNF